jgi:CysZ protein
MAVNPISGASYLLAGLRLIARPGLRRFVAIPLGINILVFSAAIYWGMSLFEGLIAWLQSRLPRLPDWLSWLSWLEQGLEWVLWPLFIMLAALLVFYGFTLVANLIGAPFNGLLAEKVERLARGAPLDKGLSMGQVLTELVPACWMNSERSSTPSSGPSPFSSSPWSFPWSAPFSGSSSPPGSWRWNIWITPWVTRGSSSGKCASACGKGRH